MIIVNTPDDWPSTLSLPPEQRHAPAPPDLLAHLERVNGYPALAATADADLVADLTEAIAGLPAIVRTRLRDNFLGVYFVTGAGSSAATDIAVGVDGEFLGIVIVLDLAAVAGRSANQWASWRENMPFATGEFRVAVRIADADHDNRIQALRFLLLHEIGHALSAGCGLLPDWWLMPGELQSAGTYTFLPLSWDLDADGHPLPLPENHFAQRAGLRYYGMAGLSSEQLLPAYRALLQTSFFSMYAALSPAEDFAESFALYVHTELMQQPYFVRIYQGDKLLLQYAAQWEEPRFAAKRAVLQSLLPDVPAWIRQAHAPLIGVAPLMRCAFRGNNMTALASALVARAEAHPDDAHAFLDCSTALQLNGNREVALALQAEAIRMRQHYRLPMGGAAPAVRLLVVMGPGDLMANTPIEFLLEDGDVALELLYVTDALPLPQELPAHDVLMVGVAESDQNQPLLRALAERLRHWPQPVLNRPEAIAVLSRDGAHAALEGIAGVEMPRTIRVARATLAQLAAQAQTLSELLPEAGFPLIVRPLGSHAGHELEKIDDAGQLQDYLARVTSGQFYLARFVDYRGAGGMFRKFRIALIDGQPFVCHYAVSAHWMVHYLNAGMDQSAEKRAEEADCMRHFDHTFARRHRSALAQIHERLGLPYFGIDCAEMPDGRLLIFEVDNAMVVHAMDDANLYAYKQPAMRKVFDAFRQLLARHAVAQATAGQ